MLAGAAAILAAMVPGRAVPRLEALFVVSTLAGCGFILYHIAAAQAAAAIRAPEQRVRNFSLLALGMLPVFWAMGLALLATGCYASLKE
jgi:hypothetical protein